ncbi:hypothetical protein [Burkholderia stagnalis]|nr:hypothetical protein [Burkholderia stagnalis]
MSRKPVQWPADKVERWPIERVIPNARNARQHTDAWYWERGKKGD